MSKKETVFEQAMSTLLAKVDTTEKFVVEQSPEVCRQLIAEKSMVEKMDMVTNASIFLASGSSLAFFIFRLMTTDFERYSDAKLGYGVGSMIAAVLVLISFFVGLQSVQNLMRLKVAPKVFLLREFSKLVNGDSEE